MGCCGGKEVDVYDDREPIGKPKVVVSPASSENEKTRLLGSPNASPSRSLSTPSTMSPKPNLTPKGSFRVKTVERRNSNRKLPVTPGPSPVRRKSMGGIVVSGPPVEEKDKGASLADIDIDDELAKIDSELNEDGVEALNDEEDLDAIDAELQRLEEEEINQELARLEALDAEEGTKTRSDGKPETESDRKNRIARNFRVRVKALWDYNGSEEHDELSFKAGDIIYLIEKDEEGWWKGELNGIEGWFPHNYVQVQKRELKLASSIDPKIKSMQQVLVAQV